MRYLSRPWASRGRGSDGPFGPSDCLLCTFEGNPSREPEYMKLMSGDIRGKTHTLVLFPYPKRDQAECPSRREFPVRPHGGQEPTSKAEKAGAEALQYMNKFLARIQ